MSALTVETGRLADDGCLLAIARSFGPLRSVTSEQAPVIRAAAEHDRSVLPRWQRQGDGIHEWAEPSHYTRGRVWVRTGRLGRDAAGHVHWRGEAFTGTPHVNWRTRDHWLDVVVTTAVKLRPTALDTRRGTVTADRFLAYCRQLSLHGHQGTGRRCIVRVDRLAELLGVSKSTIQRCQAAAEDLGLVVVIVPARMLTQDESCEARRRGSRQRGMANELAMVIPSWLPQAALARNLSPLPRTHDTPTRGTHSKSSNFQYHGSLSKQPRSAGTKEPAPPAPRRRERRVPLNRSPDDGSPSTPRTPENGPTPPRRRTYDADALDLARGLVQDLTWLRGVQPGRLEPGLRRFIHCRRPWSPRDVITAIDQANSRLGRASMTHDLVKNPPALFAKYLRDFDVDADHPRAWMDIEAFNGEPISQTQARNRVALDVRRNSGHGVASAATRAAAADTIRDELAARRAARTAAGRQS